MGREETVKRRTILLETVDLAYFAGCLAQVCSFVGEFLTLCGMLESRKSSRFLTLLLEVVVGEGEMCEVGETYVRSV